MNAFIGLRQTWSSFGCQLKTYHRIDEHYDSDSSVTAAANRSLDLSRSLGDKCSDLTQGLNSSDEEDKQQMVEVTEEKIVPESHQGIQVC